MARDKVLMLWDIATKQLRCGNVCKSEATHFRHEPRPLILRRQHCNRYETEVYR